MENYEKQFSLDIIEAVTKLKKAFDDKCNNNNPYFKELCEIYLTKEGAIDTLAETDDFIDEYLRDEYLDLIKKILSKHIWFKYFSGYIPPALEDDELYKKKMAEEHKKVEDFLKSVGEECNH